MLTILIAYSLSGVLVGLLAGLLGIGGGIIVIPLLLTLFSIQGFPQEISMHMAIGTSLAIVLLTSIFSVFAHYRKGVIWIELFKQFFPGAAVGSIFGIIISYHLKSIILQKIFAIFLILVAVYLLVQLNFKAKEQLPRKKVLFSISTLFGILSGMLGVGGGIFMVPYFNWCGVPFRNAVATSAACLLPIAFVGTLGYILIGKQLEFYSESLIYWPAFLTMGVGSILMVPMGVRFAHTIPIIRLRRIFALFLCIVGIKMLI